MNEIKISHHLKHDSICTGFLYRQENTTYGHDLALRTSDYDVGLDPAVADRGKEGHFGLQGMRERAVRIAGKLTIVSATNSGTEIKLVVPGGVIYRKTNSDPQSLPAKIKSFLRSDGSVGW